MRFFVFVISLLTLHSCEKFSYEIENLNDNKIQVLGHGGMGIHSFMPMNSLESIASCIDEGAVGTEIDVQLSKDGYLVAFHDKDLSQSTTGDGEIRLLDWDEIKDFRYKDLSIISNYSIQLLADVINSLERKEDLIFSFDCKLYSSDIDTTGYFNAFTDSIISLVQTLEIECYVESQNVDFLQLIQTKKPEYKLLYYPENFDEGYEVVSTYGFYGLSIDTEKISQQEVEHAHSNGYWITLWNVHTKNRNKEAILKSPDCIQADKLSHLLTLLE